MANNPGQEPIPPGAIRAAGEQDRSPEFKDARRQLIQGVNGWLADLAIKRDAGEALIPAVQTSPTPRVIRTILGASRPGVNRMAEERYSGVSLTGDGQSQPFVFQWVKQVSNANTLLEITEVQGTDPLHQSLYGDAYDITRQTETIADFGVETIPAFGISEYFKFGVTGDGRLSHKYRRPKFHTIVQLQTAADVELAQMAFETIVGAVENPN